LDDEDLNSKEGVKQLTGLDPNGERFVKLVERLVTELEMDPATAAAQLLAWQNAHKDLEAQIQKQAQKTKGAKPIWRCAVCGRANKPWIVCYVAPYKVPFAFVGTFQFENWYIIINSD
jgi:hypothetical protein